MKLLLNYLKQYPFSSFFLFTVILVACNFYKPVQKKDYVTNPHVMDSLISKTIIVHAPTGIFLLQNMQVSSIREEISGVAGIVPESHKGYINDTKQRYKYSPKRPEVLQEVHLYTNLDSIPSPGQAISLHLKDITKMEVLERDKGRSTGSTVLAVIGITVGTLAVATAIAFAFKESCPFISVYDGEQYLLQGETFGGAIYPSLARADFVPLPAAAIGREVSICISNELKERQYTDYAQLMLVEHAPGERITITPDGKPLKISGEMKPVSAQLNASADMMRYVSTIDNISCAFNDTLHASPVNRLVVTYAKPRLDKPLALVLSLRNSHWLEYTFNEFTRQFGEKYAEWVAQQRQKPAAELLAWQEAQHLPLTVSVRTTSGWKELKKLKTIGPLMNREVAIELGDISSDLPNIELAFSTGFMFWEIDQVHLAAYEPVPEGQIRFLDPVVARDEHGKDVLPALKMGDNIYMEQPEVGNRAYLTYRVPNYASVKGYSAFLHSRGYYEPIRAYSGEANLSFLNQMRTAGAFTSYSRERYMQVAQSAYLAAQKN